MKNFILFILIIFSTNIIFAQQKQRLYRIYKTQEVEREVRKGSTEVINKRNSFVITTPEGTRYEFGNNNEIEYSYPEPIQSLNGISYYASSWYLTKIKSQDSKYIINLNYVAETYKYSNLSSCQYVKTHCVGGFDITVPEKCNGLPHAMSSNTFVNYQNIYGRRLDKIITTTATVQFFGSASGRLDLEDATGGSGSNFARSLERIEITSGSFCKKWVLNTAYFSSDGTSTYPETKRLQLKALHEMECSTTTPVSSYNFDYLGGINSNGSNILPHRLDKNIDHWGLL